MKEDFYIERIKRRRGKPSRYDDCNVLLDTFLLYYEDCRKNPIQVSNRFGGKNKGKDIEQQSNVVNVQRPLTISGFCVYAGITNWYEFKKEAGHSTDDYLIIIHTIEDAIKTNQVEGALVKVYDSNLTARLNGLVDRQETIDSSRKMSPEDFDKLFDIQ